MDQDSWSAFPELNFGLSAIVQMGLGPRQQGMLSQLKSFHFDQISWQVD
jgi:hypothetical protein